MDDTLLWPAVAEHPVNSLARIGILHSRTLLNLDACQDGNTQLGLCVCPRGEGA